MSYYMVLSGSGNLEWTGVGFIRWNMFDTQLKVDKVTGFEEHE